MRVLVATPLYPPEAGGPATYAKILEDTLPESGIECTLVRFGSVRGYPKGLRHLLYFFMVLRAGRDADLIYALDPVSVGVPSALAAFLLGKPFVVKVVGDYAWEQGRQRFGVTEQLDQFSTARSLPFEVRILQSIEARVARHARCVVVPSEYLRRIVASWEGVDPASIRVIYNAMLHEEQALLPSAVEALARPRIVSIGRLVPWKQVEGTIDAVAAIAGATLVVVGDGPSRARLERRAAECAPSRVFFTGELAHREALAVLGSADLFVLNSTYEGLSHLLIEALSLGVPTIATRVGGNPEVITDGENGLLVPPRDTEALTKAIERLLVDDALRTRLAESARLSAERFSVASMMHKTTALLTALI